MNKKRVRAKCYSNKGITIIALIITIAVVAILAGVSIGIATNKGIIGTTKQTKKSYEEASQAEEEFESELKNWKYGNYATSTNGTMTIEDSDKLIATNYRIYGESVQDTETYGAPSPDNIVEIQSVGDYDETTKKYKIPVTVTKKNLFDISSVKKFVYSDRFTRL